MARRARSTRAFSAVALLLLILIGVYSQPALSGYSARIKLGLLAVDGATGNGIVVDAWLSVTSPGSGRVTVEPKDLVEESTALSTRIAFYLASIVDGINPELFDVRVEFETDTPVGGPSASGFMAASFLLALHGLLPDTDTTMTGMVSLTGFILPVAGVSDKVTAAKSAGYKRVLVPLSEAGNISNGISNGINVEGVCTFEEAASRLSSSYVSALIPEKPQIQPPEPIREKEAEFSHHAQLFIEKATALLDEIPRNDTRRAVVALLDEAREALDKSPYSAASIAFMALYIAASSIAGQHGFDYLEEKIGLSLDAVLANASSTVKTRLQEFNGRSVCGLWGYEALAAASVRLYLAEHAADSTKPDVKTLALLRALSAESWARLADPDFGPRVPCSLLGSVAQFFVDYMQLSYNYIRSIVGHVVFHIPMPDDRDISAWINDARKSLEEDNYPLALGLALYVVSSLEESLAHGSGLPPACIERHIAFLEKLSWVIGPSLPASLLLEYALGYGSYVETVLGDPFIQESLEVDTAVWLLHPLAITALTTEAAQPPTAHASLQWSNYYLAGIAAEAALIALIGYSLVLVSRRARAEEV
ncbi:MAG TPA: hypothetical protein EYH50_03965 [Pyrodictium delaneyi]|uniref:Lon proteolytic domain-containing protein n=1 Tax=Pyrodictium delaneyi TaxID=1273541 RepID=A0A832ZUY1_9CREN|nr:hypothetical protein [Pyrodictium delaneyi]